MEYHTAAKSNEVDLYVLIRKDLLYQEEKIQVRNSR